MMSAVSATAQPATPSPTPVPDISVNSSVELGVRGRRIEGDENKYRSDLNYKAGFRLFDSTFLIENNREDRKFFDSMLVTASGWGSDPSGSFKLNTGLAGAYSFDATLRKVKYFNYLNKATIHPTNFTGQHNANTSHHFGDFDVTLFPESKNFRAKFGYSFNDTDGPGTSTLRFRSDEFEVGSAFKTNSDDFRAAIEGRLFGFDGGLSYGHRSFRDQTTLFVNSFNPGNNPATNSSSINTFSRQYPAKGQTDFGQFFFHRTFAGRFDVTGRVIYAENKVKFEQLDALTGLNSGTPNNIVTLNQIAVLGATQRPQTRADLGFTYLIGDRFRISNTLAFDRFTIDGGNTYWEILRQTTASGGSVADSITNTLASRYTGYRRIANTFEGDVQAADWLAFNIGYRWTDRTVHVRGFDRNQVSGAATPRTEEELENRTHSLIAGFKLKPTKDWSIVADVERGESDNVFTRLANNDVLNFRLRSLARLNTVTLNLSGIVKNNDSPGRTIPVSTGSGSSTITVPAFDSVAYTRIRTFAASIDWDAHEKVSLAAGYNYNYLNSITDIIVPVGTPAFPSSRFVQGISEFYVRESYFHFDVTARPARWASLFASYRITDDKGQGDRITTRAQDVITSFPIKYQTPEFRIAFRLSDNIDWNLGYQYYSYTERPVQLAFITLPFIAQNYRAHLPYTSLRFYFGRSKDR